MQKVFLLCLLLGTTAKRHWSFFFQATSYSLMPFAGFGSMVSIPGEMIFVPLANTCIPSA